MFTDVTGLALALLAVWFGERAATSERTYGYYRGEILAALFNATLLIFVSLYVLYEAYRRFLSPPEIASGAVLMVAVIGLLVNVAGIYLLKSGSSTSLNIRGAYFELLSDALTSIGVIVAAIVMWTTRWYYADPLISALIGLLILPRTWKLLTEALGVLLEGTPANVNMASLREAMNKAEGVEEVHDLHVWTITSGMNALSAHVRVDAVTNQQEVLSRLHNLVTKQFPIQHVTLQIETEHCHGQGVHA